MPALTNGSEGRCQLDCRNSAPLILVGRSEKCDTMALVGKPVATAVAGELVARVAPNQEPGIANTVQAEALLGDVGQGIARRALR